MDGRTRASVIVTLTCLTAMLFGCADMPPREQPPSTEVVIADFRSIAGHWAGLLKTEPRVRTEDWVTATIGEDGSYSFASYRDIGVLRGKGTFTLANGKLTSRSDRGHVTGTLYEEGGKRMLKVEATEKGSQYSAELTPER